MKSNTFNYSLLAVGVAAVMGLSTGANAAPSLTPTATESGNAGTNSKTIINVATASYSVGGQTQKDVESNPVTVNINEVISFSLTANNIDDVQNDEKNINTTVVPEGFVTFKHTLTNTGNLDDTYTFTLTDLSSAKYNLAGSNANVIIKNASGTQTASYPITGITTGSLPLPAGYSAEITINAKTTGNQGDSTQNLQLSAESTKIAAIANPANGATKTLTNIDESSTILPVFSIAKTITSGTFNVNDPTAEVSYKVVVKNVNLTYSKDATDVKIEDFLPDGLIMSQGLVSTNITTTGTGTTINNSSITNTSNGFSFVATSLPKDGEVIITFKAKKNPDVALAQNALNHVMVTDNLNEGVGPDNILVDSTNGLKEKNINFYPAGGDTNITDGTSVADGKNGNDSTQPLNSTQRSLTLTNPQTIQIPTTTNSTTQANHSVTITNTGRDSESNLTFTLVESNTAANVSVSNVQVGGTVLTAVNGIYTPPNTLNSNSSVDITYLVTSNDAKVGTTETTTVTLIPNATPGNSPTVAPVVDTTQVRGIELAKTQALDANCDGNPEGSFGTTLNVEAGQCVVYNIKATNTFDSAVTGSYSIASLVISDDLIKNGVTTSADYLLNSANTKNTSGTATVGTVTAPSTVNDQVVSNTVDTLAPQATANLQFAIKTKQN